MARTSIIEDLFRITSQLPWWLSTAMGGALYWVFKYHLPTRTTSPTQVAWTPMFTAMAYGFLTICLAGAAISLFRDLRRKRLFSRQTSIRSIRELSWLEFEHFVLEAYRRQGYAAQATDNGADGGVDVILNKDGETTLVQCKQWQTQNVGVKPVRELAGVVASESADRGMMVCSGRYTREAREFAARANIELVSSKELEKLIRPLQREFETTTPPPTSSTCPRCGSDLVRRVARRGKHTGDAFFGCAAFPKCRYTRDT